MIPKFNVEVFLTIFMKGNEGVLKHVYNYNKIGLVTGEGLPCELGPSSMIRLLSGLK